MNRSILALALGALCAAGAGAQVPAKPSEAERQRYEQGVREAEAARLRYEEAQRQHQADLVRHQREVERAERAQRRYERRRARYDARQGDRQAEQEPAPPSPAAAPVEPAPTAAPVAPVSSERCEEQNRRNRGRGRAIGGLIGGVAGSALGRGNAVRRLATIALSAPVGALIGESIARLLDCREQQQAAAATEQVVERGVGASTTWESETRPGVTGSSTVTAAAPPMSDGNPCMTVTDIIIVDGEETRAEKRMCRRPPSNRYARV